MSLLIVAWCALSVIKTKKVRTGKRGNWISEHDAGFIFVTLFHLPWRQRPFERGWKIAKNADPSDYHQLHPRDSFPDLTWRWVEKALSFNKEEAGATGVLFVSYKLCYTHEVMQRVIQYFAGYKVSYLQWNSWKLTKWTILDISLLTFFRSVWSLIVGARGLQPGFTPKVITPHHPNHITWFLAQFCAFQASWMCVCAGFVYDCMPTFGPIEMKNSSTKVRCYTQSFLRPKLLKYWDEMRRWDQEMRKCVFCTWQTQSSALSVW